MERSRLLWLAAGLSILGIGVLSIPIPRTAEEKQLTNTSAIARLDLSGYSSQPSGNPLDVLFIHHSCGGQLLAAFGAQEGAHCIMKSDPNGGNLRARLEQNGYWVHEASYGSRIGEKTDLFDWLPKFQAQMDEILRCDRQDTLFTDGRRNQVVMFKSCFPNNAFRSGGTPPGSPVGPELTVWNAKAAYGALLEEFRKQPDVLFVCLTAPPLAPGKKTQPLWRQLARTVKRRLQGTQFDLAESGRLAREFNNWLSDTGGWLANYPLKNVVVFDYYDIMTDNGQSDLCRYPTWGGDDSHPSREGNEKAAQVFVPFLNQVVHRAGLAGQGVQSSPVDNVVP